jgi:hypothetical protein
MPKQSTILNKLKSLKDAAWNFQIRDFDSRAFARKYADKTEQLIREGIRMVGEEAGETEQMARSFFRLLAAKLDLEGRTDPPTPEEVKAAVEQLKDMGRFSIFATLVILPGGLVSLLGLELLARKFGIKGFNLMPSSFRRKKGSQPPAKTPEDNVDPLV